MKVRLIKSWQTQLDDTIKAPFFKRLTQFVFQEYEQFGCYPYEEGPALAGPGVFANRMGQFSRRSVSQNR